MLASVHFGFAMQTYTDAVPITHFTPFALLWRNDASFDYTHTKRQRKGEGREKDKDVTFLIEMYYYNEEEQQQQQQKTHRKLWIRLSQSMKSKAK